MRLSVFLLALLAPLAACARQKPVVVPKQAAPRVVVRDVPPGPQPPKVVRRLVAEERELVRGNQTMARELPDPSGRARATEEADALAAELEVIAAPIDAAFREEREVDSDVLDAAIDKLLLLDTRVTLLHEKLLAATERRTAVVVDR